MLASRRIAMLCVFGAAWGCVLPEAHKSRAGAGGMGTTSTATGGAGLSEVTDAVTADEDDAMWFSCDSASSALESLHEDLGGVKSIFIAGGAFDECIGLRFQLNGIPNGAHIESAVVTMRHLNDGGFRDTQPTASVTVHAWNTATLEPFAAHNHQPEDHDRAGFVRAQVSWEIVTDVPRPTPLDSPNLAPLLQPLVDGGDWSQAANIGFAFIDFDPELVYDIRIADYATVGEGQPAALVVRYGPP